MVAWVLGVIDCIQHYVSPHIFSFVQVPRLYYSCRVCVVFIVVEFAVYSVVLASSVAHGDDSLMVDASTVVMTQYVVPGPCDGLLLIFEREGHPDHTRELQNAALSNVRPVRETLRLLRTNAKKSALLCCWRHRRRRAYW